MTDACGIRRGRVFVRRLGAMTGNWRYGGNRSDGQAYGMVGVVEVDEVLPWQRERSHRFSTLLSSTGGMLSFTGTSDAPEYRDDLAFSEIDSFITTMDFPRTDEVREALGWGAGGMVLRDTRGPSSPGTTLATVAMAVCMSDARLPDAHMASIVVDGDDVPYSARLTIEEPCRMDTGGTNLSQVLKLPLWGWGVEPFGFSSTMRLDAIDRCTRVQDAMTTGDPSPEEARRLRASVQHAVQDNSDPVFAMFRRRLAADGLMRPWDATLTASEMLTRDRSVELLVNELLAAGAQGRFAA